MGRRKRRRKKIGFKKIHKVIISYQVLILIIICLQLIGYDLIIKKRINEIGKMVGSMSIINREVMKLCGDGLKWRYWDK